MKIHEYSCEFLSITYIFTGRQLIAYVRAWQNVVNDLATQHGDAAFHFNTYIISVLVIFFMQVQYDLPTAGDVSILVASGKANLSRQSILEEQKDFNRILYEFFHFYGIRYEINNHLISVRIGRWQEQKLTQQQKYFTPEQKRLAFIVFFFFHFKTVSNLNQVI